MRTEGKEAQRVAEGLHAIAAEAVPADLDLWPGIRAEIEAAELARRNGRPTAPRETPGVRRPAKRRGLALAAGLAILALAVGLASAPVMGAAVLEFFGLEGFLVHEATVTATVPASVFTGTPPSSTPRPTPTPLPSSPDSLSRAVGGAGPFRAALHVEDTPLPQ